jgi:putative sigma-54 modulation protein
MYRLTNLTCSGRKHECCGKEDSMKYVIVGKNVEVTPGLDEAIRDKIGRLDKYFSEDTIVNVTLNVDKDRHKIEVTIPVKGSLIRCEQVSNDMYVSIDLVEEIIERQLKKYKNKIVDRHQQGAGNFKREYIDHDYMDDEEIRIVRKKQFDMKPMYPEDACVQMELLGHDFFVFRNAETEQINVVYKRKGNTYGLIEPEE